MGPLQSTNTIKNVDTFFGAWVKIGGVGYSASNGEKLNFLLQFNVKYLDASMTTLDHSFAAVYQEDRKSVPQYKQILRFKVIVHTVLTCTNYKFWSRPEITTRGIVPSSMLRPVYPPPHFAIKPVPSFPGKKYQHHITCADQAQRHIFRLPLPLPSWGNLACLQSCSGHLICP